MKNYRFRAIRNILLALALYLLYWYCIGAPLPTMEMELHRDERQRLLPAGRIVWEYDTNQFNDRRVIVGLAPNHISTHTEDYRTTLWHRSADQPTLILLPDELRYNQPGTAQLYRTPVFAAADAPARAKSARLTVEASYNDWSDIYTVQGRDEGALWLFQMEYKHLEPTALQVESMTEAELTLLWEQHGLEEDAFHCLSVFPVSDTLEGIPYTLEFFDKDGVLLETITNNP